MTGEDHVALLRGGVGGTGAWADLGSGAGAFTLALAALLGPAARLYAVDRDAQALRALEREMGTRHSETPFTAIRGDFNDDLALPPMDGIVMANSLHFQADACAVLLHAARWLRPGGRLIVVEYDIEAPNPWVPFPVPYSRLVEVCGCADLDPPRLLATRPSRYHRRLYSAVSGRGSQSNRIATGT